MLIAGVDCSSFAIDIVTVPLDEGEGQVEWHCFKLGPGADAFDRTRSVPDSMPGRHSRFWEDILAIGIEEPTGRFKPGSGFRVQGAVLAMIPRETLVRPIQPSAWRRLVGLPGNCSKETVFAWVTEELCGRPRSQDAADAYCMALATRALVLREHEREVAHAGKT